MSDNEKIKLSIEKIVEELKNIGTNINPNIHTKQITQQTPQTQQTQQTQQTTQTPQTPQNQQNQQTTQTPQTPQNQQNQQTPENPQEPTEPAGYMGPQINYSHAYWSRSLRNEYNYYY